MCGYIAEEDFVETFFIFCELPFPVTVASLVCLVSVFVPMSCLLHLFAPPFMFHLFWVNLASLVCISSHVLPSAVTVCLFLLVCFCSFRPWIFLGVPVWLPSSCLALVVQSLLMLSFRIYLSLDFCLWTLFGSLCSLDFYFTSVPGLNAKLNSGVFGHKQIYEKNTKIHWTSW